MKIKTLQERACEMAGDFKSRLAFIRQALANTPRPRAEVSKSVQHLSDVKLRRQISRLRAGVIQPLDPAVKGGALADDLEKELACRLLSRQVLAQFCYMRDFLSSEMDMASAGMMECALAAFRELKELPEARDTTTALSGKVRRLHRLLHDEQGRTRQEKRLPAGASDIQTHCAGYEGEEGTG